MNLTLQVLFSGPKAAKVREQFQFSDHWLHSDCLQQYSKRRNELQDGNDTPHEVLILYGGFTEFQKRFKVTPRILHTCLFNSLKV